MLTGWLDDMESMPSFRAPKIKSEAAQPGGQGNPVWRTL